MLCSWRLQRKSFLLVPLYLIVLALTPCIFAQQSEAPTTAPTTQPTNTTNTTTYVPSGPNIDYELESILALRWKLLKPKIAYDGLRFDMVFTTSDFIREELIVYTLYDGHACSAGGTVSNDLPYFETYLTGDNTPVGGGLKTRQFTLSTEIVTETIAQSASYEEFGDVATIQFCVRFALYNEDVSVNPSSAMEINYLETTITLIVDLRDNFKIQDPIVEARDAAAETASDAFFVEGFICNEAGVPPQDTVPLNQGETVRVCVQPTRQALDVGFRMRRIDNFVFNQGSVNQEAVKDSLPSINGLTQLWCDSGSEQCAFETLLLAYFYAGPTLVTGSGIATLQFGSNQRRLRSLQVARGVAKTFDLSPFGLRTVYNRFTDASGGASAFSGMFPMLLLVGSTCCWFICL